jgi:hypothetical protein
MTRTGGGEPPAAGRWSSGGRRLGGQGAAWSRWRSLNSNSSVGCSWRWPSIGEAPVEVDNNDALLSWLEVDGGFISGWIFMVARVLRQCSTRGGRDCACRPLR